MIVTKTGLDGVLLVKAHVHSDDRGAFLETWQRSRYAEAGVAGDFVQDNVAFSTHKVLRGLHYQFPNPQGKLVMALSGTVFDVAVDIRRGSPTFGRWIAEILNAESGHQLWVPEGFAHGYAVLSEHAVVAYKCTEFYQKDSDASILFDDPAIGIDWPVRDPLVSEKDASAPLLVDIPADRLPIFQQRR